MKTPEELKKIEKELKKSAKQYFKPKSKEIKDELEKAKTLGSLENLIEPSDRDES